MFREPRNRCGRASGLASDVADAGHAREQRCVRLCAPRAGTRDHRLGTVARSRSCCRSDRVDAGAGREALHLAGVRGRFRFLAATTRIDGPDRRRHRGIRDIGRAHSRRPRFQNTQSAWHPGVRRHRGRISAARDPDRRHDQDHDRERDLDERTALERAHADRDDPVRVSGRCVVCVGIATG